MISVDRNVLFVDYFSFEEQRRYNDLCLSVAKTKESKIFIAREVCRVSGRLLNIAGTETLWVEISPWDGGEHKFVDTAYGMVHIVGGEVSPIAHRVFTS